MFWEREGVNATQKAQVCCWVGNVLSPYLGRGICLAQAQASSTKGRGGWERKSRKNN